MAESTEPPNPETSPPQASGFPPPSFAEVNTAYLASRRKEEERQAELQEPSLVTEREHSRTAYADLSAQEAEELLRSTFAATFARLNVEPARVLSDARLEANLGDGAAVIENEGRKEILEAGIPIEKRNPEGELEKVDVSLEEGPEGFEPENPPIELTIGGTADEGVEVGVEGDGEAVTLTQVGAEGSSGHLLGDKNVFYPEPEEGSDTDLMVSPTSRGVELFDMLRSFGSPETLRFDLELPQGDTLRQSASGGAEVVGPDGLIVGLVDKPSGEDAQGTYVPVDLQVEGSTVVLQTNHREEDLAYPILIDPDIETHWSSWWQNQGLGSLSYWQWYTNVGWTHSLVGEPEGGPWHGTHGLFQSTQNGQLTAGGYSEYYLNAPNLGSYLHDVEIYPFYRNDQECWPYAQPYDFAGYYDVVQHQWNGEVAFNDAHNYAKTLHANWGHQYDFGLGVSVDFESQCWRDLMAGGVAFGMGDWGDPTLTEISGGPTQWINSSTFFGVHAQATDGGLGVRSITFTPGGTSVPIEEWAGCYGTYESPCPPGWGGTFSFTGAGFSEGEREIQVSAMDALLKNSNTRTFTLKVDQTPPTLQLHGQLMTAVNHAGPGEGQNGGGGPELSQPVYNLKIDATDGAYGTSNPAARRSGVKKIEVLVENAPGETLKETFENPSCSQSSCELHATYPLKLIGLNAGAVHKLEVKAYDFAGNQPETRQIEFEYMPSTGMSEDFVLQHFPLPDGNNHESEAVNHGPELAVNVMNGNVVYHQRDVNVEGPSVDLEAELFYNSQLPKEQSSAWGRGWTLSQMPKLERTATGTGADRGSALTGGSTMTGKVDLPQEEGQPRFSSALNAVVTKRTGGGYAVSEEAESPGTTTVYNAAGQTTEVQTGSHTSLNYSYEGARLAGIQVEDPAATTLSPKQVAERGGGKTEGQPAYQSAFGARGADAGEFVNPGGMALDAAGNLWIADTGNDRVEEFNGEGKFLAQVATWGVGERLREPAAVATDASGNVLVADAGNYCVEEFGPKGEFIRRFGAAGIGGGQFSGAGPQGIAISPAGAVLVSDAGGHRVQRFSSSGAFIEAFGAAQLAEPDGLAVGPAGNIWVADRGANKIVAFKESGQPLRSFGKTGEEEGQLKKPAAVGVNSKGQVFVADTGNGRVQEFTEAGTFLHEFGSREGIKGRFSSPAGLVTDSKGDIWVAATANAPERVEAAEEVPSGPPPREGLVAAYSFDENEGTVAHDSSGHGHNATIEGAKWTSGRYGSALEFDPAKQNFLTVPGSEDLRLGHYTLEAWVDPRNSRAFAPVIAKWSASDYGYALYAGGEVSGHPEGLITYHEWVNSYAYGPAALSLNTWSHLALTNDGKKLRLYVNGTLVNERAAAEVQAGESPLRIGGNPGSPITEFFDGKLDEIRIYNRALSAEEVGGDRDTLVSLAMEKATRFQIEKWKTTDETPLSPPEDDPSLQVSYASGLVSKVSGAQAGQHSYGHEGELLTADQGPEGTTTYKYDASGRLNKVTLPNGTIAEVAYDSTGRATKVSVDPAGAEPRKSTNFSYGEEAGSETRITTVEPESPLRRTFYAIGSDDSVLRWSNAEAPPAFRKEAGTLVERREKELGVGDQTLTIEGHAAEGVSKIQFLVNGTTVVDERTYTGTRQERENEQLQWITNTEDLQPGTMWIEALVTDSLNNTASKRWWVTVPYIPPPPPGVPTPPRYKTVLAFREEYGLDLDLDPIANELELHERIIETLGAWHNPQTPLGEVARASWERWGVPLRPSDVANLEWRETYLAHDLPLVEEWAAESHRDSYGGYTVDNRAGGLVKIGFTSAQGVRVEELKAQLPLMASGQISGETVSPAISLEGLDSAVADIEDALESNEVLDNNIVEIGVDEQANTVLVGATSVGAVSAALSGVVGPGVPVRVYAEEEGGPFAGRYQVSGRIQAGDAVWGVDPPKEGKAQIHPCTAGFGAWEALGTKPNGDAEIAPFLLTAGHCARDMGREWVRSAKAQPAAQSDLHKIGVARRTGAPGEGQHYETDVSAIRLEAGIVPTTVYKTAASSRSIDPAGVARHGETLCFSGVTTNEVKCGEMVGVRYRRWPKEGGKGGRHLFIITRFAGLHGDSGAPVWSPKSGQSIGILSGGPNDGRVKDWVTPLLQPRGFSAEKVPGALQAPGMGHLHIREGS